MILVVIDDLMFSVQIKDVAKQLGVDLQTVKTSEKFNQILSESNIEKLIVDLHCKKVNPNDCIKEFKTKNPHGEVLAFFSHVETELAVVAKEQGADQVLPRSKFFQKLSEYIQ